jgi:hypothetical protein
VLQGLEKPTIVEELDQLKKNGNQTALMKVQGEHLVSKVGSQKQQEKHGIVQVD